MPRSRESVLAELDARQVGYNEDMSYAELCELLKQAEAKEAEAAKPLAIDYTGVRCGVSTIHDLHRRLSIVEHKLGL